MPPLKVIQYIHKYIFLIIKNKFTLLINKKSIFTKNYYKNTDFDLNEIQKCIPESVKEKKTNFLWDNRFYCITFRK